MLVDLGDIRLNVIDEGDGQPVVFLHGLGANHRMWTLQLDTFHGEFRCISPDLRGAGQSDQPPGPYSADLFADDVAKLCQHLGVQRAVIVGQSMGGIVAQALAVHHPDLIQGLVLVGTVCEGRHGTAWEGAGDVEDVIREHGMAVLLDQIMDSVYPRSFQEAHPERVWHFRRELLSWDTETFLTAFKREVLTDYPAELRKVQIPTLIIGGRHDAICEPEESEFLHEVIPGSELVILEHCGHQPFYEDPDTFDPMLRDFIARPDVAQRATTALGV